MTKQDQETDIEKFILQLENQKKAIDNAIASLRALSKAGLSNPPSIASTANNGHKISKEIGSDTFFGKGFLEAVVQYLGWQGTQQTTANIIDAVRKGGVKIGDASAQTMLTAQGRKKEDIVRMGRGEWGLKEWYKG